MAAPRGQRGVSVTLRRPSRVRRARARPRSAQQPADHSPAHILSAPLGSPLPFSCAPSSSPHSISSPRRDQRAFTGRAGGHTAEPGSVKRCRAWVEHAPPVHQEPSFLNPFDFRVLQSRSTRRAPRVDPATSSRPPAPTAVRRVQVVELGVDRPQLVNTDLRLCGLSPPVTVSPRNDRKCSCVIKIAVCSVGGVPASAAGSMTIRRPSFSIGHAGVPELVVTRSWSSPLIVPSRSRPSAATLAPRGSARRERPAGAVPLR